MHSWVMETQFDIRAEREKVGLSQAAVAAALGVNQSTVARWETNPSQCRSFALEAVKRAIANAGADVTTSEDAQ